MSLDIVTPESEIAAAIQSLKIPAAEFRRCDPTDAQAVLARAMERYVNDNPRAWWLRLKRRPTEVVIYEHNFQHLLAHIPADEERCWFIPETETARPVFDVDKRWLEPVLNECSFFEYYVVGKSFDWLLIDNDHGELMVVVTTRE